MRALPQRLRGGLWIAASAAGFGAMAIFAKLAYAEGVGLETLLFLRFALGGACLALILRWRRQAWPAPALWPGLAAMGGIAQRTLWKHCALISTEANNGPQCAMV